MGAVEHRLGGRLQPRWESAPKVIAVRLNPHAATSPTVALGLLALTISGCGLTIGGCGSSSSSSSSSGGGIESKSPEEIVAAAKKAATTAATVHIVGETVNEGRPLSIDLQLVAGKGGSGRVAVEGSEIEIVAVEHAYYIRGGTAFYTRLAGPEAARLLQGRWVKATEKDGSFNSFARLTDLGEVLGSTLDSHGTLAAAGTATIEGQKVVGVTDTTKGGTLYVAATGTPYPLEIVRSGTDSGRIRFNRWNQPVTLTPPTSSINIRQLQNGPRG